MLKRLFYDIATDIPGLFVERNTKDNFLALGAGTAPDRWLSSCARTEEVSYIQPLVSYATHVRANTAHQNVLSVFINVLEHLAHEHLSGFTLPSAPKR